MALAVPPWGFQHCTTNITGTPTFSPGAAPVLGASNADGSTVTLHSALAHDVHLLELCIYGTGGLLSNSLMDVMIDPAGGTSWTEFISDIVCGFQPAQGSASINNASLQYSFPIWIPAGASLGVRGRNNDTATNSSWVVSHVYGDPSRPQMWWCGQKVETLGVTAASSDGTVWTPGASGTMSTPWTTIGTSTAHYGAVQLGFNGADDGTVVARGLHIQMGYGSTQLPGSPTFYHNTGTAEIYAQYLYGLPIWCDVPAGTVWQVRGTYSGTASDAVQSAIYGIY